MKILYFLHNGQATKEAIEYRFDESRKGNNVSLCNGSLIKGFETSCDKVVLAVENKFIEKWAEGRSIPVEKIGIESPVDESPIDTAEITVDTIANAQVEKAEASLFSVPKNIDKGIYISPEGAEFEKKAGPTVKKDFKEAIEKFGFEAFTRK
jgi:hypothetical protein